MPDLSGKVAIVTGGAQGIGRGIVHVLADYHADVVFNDIDTAAAAQTVRECHGASGETLYVPGDVRNEADVKRLVEETIARHGRIDAVINNAATILVESMEEGTVETWDQLFQVNVRSIFLTSKHALPYMKRQGGGSIVNVGSVSSLIGQQNTPAYCATKGAVLMLTKAMALDYAAHAIRVNCLCPGITDTPMLERHMSHCENPAEELAARVRRVPTGKLMAPRDLGESAAFLVSSAAAQVTGTTIVVDGGYSACAEFSP